MITTRMNVSEILEEYKKDYSESLRPKFFRFIYANEKKIKKSQKQRSILGESDWVPCKEIKITTTKKFNTYRSVLKVRYNIDKPGFISVTYLILNNSNGGGKLVYLLPAGESETRLITLLPKFFQEFSDREGFIPKSFQESVDNFMKVDKTYIIYTQDVDNQEYNCQIDFGNDNIGFGYYDPLKETLIVRNFRKGEELIQEAINKNIESRDPLTIFLKLSIPEEKDLSNLSDKEREIEEAWREYENLDRLKSPENLISE